MNRSEVVVIGAGPSGLTAAVLLALHQVPFRIVDKKEKFSENSRAVGIQSRSLEVFEQMGVVEEVLSAGRRAHGVDVHTARGVVRIDLFGARWMDTAYPFLFLLEQSVTEKILARRLLALGHAIEWSHEVVRVENEEPEVVLTIRGLRGEAERVAASWVVAADGASSFVRESVDVPFTGSTYEQRFVVADVETVRGRLDPHHVNLNFNETGFLLLGPLTRPGAYRLASNVPPQLAGSGSDPVFDDLRRHVDRVFPGGLEIRAPQWFSIFRIHSRGVERFRHGRIFFVGDAAHVHSPVGGQGMNTGIQDAHNLAWKLALTIRGVLPEEALDSYHEERHPVAGRLVATTDRIFRMVDRQGPLARAFRMHVYPRLAQWIVGAPALRRRVARIVSQIGIRYERGLFLPDQGRWRFSAPEPGKRFPVIAFGIPAFDYRRHHLLVIMPSDAAGSTPRVIDPWIEEAFQGAVERRVATTAGGDRQAVAGVHLIRPDGYVALRVPLEQWTELPGLVRRYLRRDLGAGRSHRC